MMNRQHDPDKPKGIPLSAVYRQLDGHPAAGAEGYDPAATVARWIATCADDRTASAPDSASTSSPVTTEPPSDPFSDDRELVMQLAARRLANTIAAFTAILAISTIAAATALISHFASPALAGIGATAMLLACSVVLVHWVTMRSMTADYDRLAGQGWEAKPRGRKIRIRLFEGLGAAAAALVAVVIALHAGAAGLIALTAAACILFAVVTGVLATALFGSTSRSERAFIILRMVLHRSRSTERGVRVTQWAELPDDGHDAPVCRPVEPWADA